MRGPAACVAVMRSTLSVVGLAAMATFFTAACGGDDVGVASQPTQHVEISVSRTPLTSYRFGRVSQIPRNAPQWLVIRAHLMASALHDPQPARVRIRLRHDYLIEMWGRFVCTLCSRPSGAKAPRGTHAWTRIEPHTRRDIVFRLTRR
jgi:hypothetical protein